MEVYQLDSLGYSKTAVVISCSCYMSIEDWQWYSAHHSEIWADRVPPPYKLLVAVPEVKESIRKSFMAVTYSA